MTSDDKAVRSFQNVVMQYFVRHGRHDLPWRTPEAGGSFDPYKILVSELMLQQTQVARVRQKYAEFLRAFPSVQSLAAADLGEVLIVWQGLGYNRRAKFLWQAAQKIVQDFGGVFPRTQAELETLPGVGENTAGAVVAYAFNQPAVFVETNIRTVFIHHFFHDQTDVPDQEIRELVARTLPKDEGKEQGWLSRSENSDLFRKRQQEKPPGFSCSWYWALMDYGTYLKQTVGNVARASKSYAKQSKFEGSLRQVRGQILRSLSKKSLTIAGLSAEIADQRLSQALLDLEREELVRRHGETYSLFQM